MGPFQGQLDFSGGFSSAVLVGLRSFLWILDLKRSEERAESSSSPQYYELLLYQVQNNYRQSEGTGLSHVLDRNSKRAGLCVPDHN